MKLPEVQRRSVAVVSISVSDTEASLRAYVGREGYTWHHGLDDSRTMLLLAAFSIPTVVVIDAEGVLQYRGVGSTKVAEAIGVATQLAVDSGIVTQKEVDDGLAEAAAAGAGSTADAQRQAREQAAAVRQQQLQREQEVREAARRGQVEDVVSGAEKADDTRAGSRQRFEEQREEARRARVNQAAGRQATETPGVARHLSSSSLSQLAWFAAGAGVVSFVSPCSFFMLPGYASHFIERRYGWRPVAALSLSASLGLMLVYSVVTLMATTAVGVMGGADTDDGFVTWVLNGLGSLATISMGAFMVVERQLTTMQTLLSKLKLSLRHGAQRAFGKTAVSNTFEFVAEAPQTVLETMEVRSLEGGGDDSASDYDSSGKGHGGGFHGISRHDPNELDFREITSLFWFGVAYGTSSAGCSSPVFVALLSMSWHGTAMDVCVVFSTYTLAVVGSLLVFTAFVAAFRELLLQRLSVPTRGVRRLAGAVLVMAGLKQLVMGV